MLSHVWTRGRIAALSAVGIGGLLTATMAGVAATGAATTGAATTRVPWSAVGPGWVLAEYATGAGKTAVTTMYVISPAGTRYRAVTWHESPNALGDLFAWSGDKTRALFDTGATGPVTQLNLVTGKVRRFAMAGDAVALGYTLPDGQNILGTRSPTFPVATLGRYSLTGKLLKTLATSDDAMIDGVYSADGARLAVSGTTGLELVSNAGKLVRDLPVPGVAGRFGCTAARWWNPGTILAQCFTGESLISRLWLVPANGARPAPLTPQRPQGGQDIGDLGAWRLSSGLYVQSSLGACSLFALNKQHADGSVTAVKVPGTPNVSSEVITAAGPRLLIEALTGCAEPSSVLWFNPATRARTWLFRNASGLTGLVAYNSTENAAG
jgi:hypothetical protein